jgi:hypothetical protein
MPIDLNMYGPGRELEVLSNYVPAESWGQYLLDNYTNEQIEEFLNTTLTGDAYQSLGGTVWNPDAGMYDLDPSQVIINKDLISAGHWGDRAGERMRGWGRSHEGTDVPPHTIQVGNEYNDIAGNVVARAEDGVYKVVNEIGPREGYYSDDFSTVTEEEFLDWMDRHREFISDVQPIFPEARSNEEVAEHITPGRLAEVAYETGHPALGSLYEDRFEVVDGHPLGIREVSDAPEGSLGESFASDYLESDTRPERRPEEIPDNLPPMPREIYVASRTPNYNDVGIEAARGTQNQYFADRRQGAVDTLMDLLPPDANIGDFFAEVMGSQREEQMYDQTTEALLGIAEREGLSADDLITLLFDIGEPDSSSKWAIQRRLDVDRDREDQQQRLREAPGMGYARYQDGSPGGVSEDDVPQVSLWDVDAGHQSRDFYNAYGPLEVISYRQASPPRDAYTLVVVNQNDGVELTFRHLDEDLGWEPGDIITRGETIGAMHPRYPVGEEGLSPHHHIETRLPDGTWMNSSDYLERGYLPTTTLRVGDLMSEEDTPIVPHGSSQSTGRPMSPDNPLLPAESSSPYANLEVPDETPGPGLMGLLGMAIDRIPTGEERQTAQFEEDRRNLRDMIGYAMRLDSGDATTDPEYLRSVGEALSAFDDERFGSYTRWPALMQGSDVGRHLQYLHGVTPITEIVQTGLDDSFGNHPIPRHEEVPVDISQDIPNQADMWGYIQEYTPVNFRENPDHMRDIIREHLGPEASDSDIEYYLRRAGIGGD